MSSDGKKSFAPPWPWALITGLLLGFIVGREVGGREGGGPSRVERQESSPTAAAAPSAPLPSKVYKSEAEFPSGWLKAADLSSVAGLSFAGLSAAQQTTVMQALNEKNCECGCGMGSVALCAKKDPNCPRSPKIARAVVDLAKQGKGLPDLLVAIDRENAPNAAQAAEPARPAGPRKVAIPAHSPRKGAKASKVTVVAFSDFQCPFCKRVLPTLKQIEDTYGKDVALVFVNQPLPFHDKARGAAQAFFAAHRQGKAWAMHDKMFENNTALDRADLERYARELGLDVNRFKRDMDDPALAKQIDEDQALANSVGANGTPTFFINGREVVGAAPFTDFKAVIDDEIKKADALLAKGAKLGELYDKLSAGEMP